MANIKFSDFAVRTTIPTVDYIVGYQGADNIQISPTDLLGDYLPLAGGTMTGVTGVVVPDNFKWNFGTGSDFYIDYDGTDATIENKDGDLYIVNSAGAGITGKNIYFQSDGGYGSAATYFYLDGSSGAATNYTRWPDEARIAFGDSKDFRMWFDGVGTNMYMTNYGGDFWFSNEQTDGDIIFRSDNGAGSLAEYFRLDGGDVETIFSKNTVHLDNVKAKFGGGNDLQIYHDGSNSYIEDTGTGNLILKAANRLYIFDDGGDYMAAFKKDDAVELYYDGLKKLETTATGIEVTDEVSIGTSLVHTGDTDTKVSFGTDEIVLTTAGTDRMTVESDGKIQVGSDKVIWAGGYGGALVIRKNDATADRLIKMVTVDSGGAIVIDNVLVVKAANVGIGTETPVEKFHVSTANNTVAKFESTDSNANIRVGDTVDNTHLGTDGGKTYIGPDTAVGGNNITITSTGDVGIGTDSPVAKLSVTGASAAANDIGIFQVTTGTGAHTDTKLTVGVVDNDYAWVEAGTPGTAIRDFMINPRGGGNVAIGTVNTNRSGLGIDHTVLTIGTDAGMGMLELQGTRTSDADLGRIAWLNAGTRRSEIVVSRIDEDTSTKMAFSTSNAGSMGTRMTIAKDGNVGIGTTAPASKLSIEDGDLEFLTTSAATIKNKIIFSESVWGDESFYIEHDGSGAGAANILKIYGDGSGGTARGIVIARTGDVGMGTVTPTAALQVVGLVEYADNAAAITAGLTAGAFYRTGDLLKVVH